MELRATRLWMSGIAGDAEEIRILTERAIAGDVSAFEQIVVRYDRRVMTLAWRLLGNPEDARDAAQDVFLRAFKYLPRFDARRPIEPWLVRMTVNVCRNAGRKRTRDAVLQRSEPQSHPSTDPGSELESEERKLMLHAALQELPEKEKAAVILRDIEGLTTAEVAGILNSSESTVRVQVSAARLRIRKIMQRMAGGQ